MSLKIGNIVIPGQAGFDLRQAYEPILARTLLRAKSGSGIPQFRWQKIRSTIAGSGWYPTALDALDLSATHAVSCIEPMSVYGAGTAITIPHTFRTDSGYSVQAAALLGDDLVETAVSMAGQVATLTPVAGASQYQVIYFPIITGLLTVNKSGDIDNQLRGWTIEAEEV